jgi:hypothetical protein
VITTAEFLRIVAAIILVTAAIFFMRSIAGERRARTAAYYSTRREAQQLAVRRLSTAITLIVIAAGLAIISFILPSELPATGPGSEPTVAVGTPNNQPTVYIVPTSTPLVSPTPAASQTPQPTAAHAIIATKPAATDTSARHLTLRAISNAVDALGLPIGASTEFSKGVPAIYVFFDFRDVPSGTLMRQTWFRDGGSVYFDSTTWTRSGDGSTYVVWSPKNGFDPGLYEVRIMLGDVKQFSANFMVR